MPDGIDAAVEEMQSPIAYAAVDRLGRKAELAELRAGRHASLAARETSDLMVPGALTPHGEVKAPGSGFSPRQRRNASSAAASIA
jgi:hypothetical protein